MRCVTILGPSNAGKSTLTDALVALEGKPGRVFDVPGVARMLNFDFMGEDWAAIDVAGGAENLAPVGAALAASDAAVLVVPADAEAAVLAAPYLRMIEAAALPCLIFINKVDAAGSRMSEVISALQTYSRHHIVLREVPIREGSEIVGVVDLVSERAWKFEEGGHSTLIEMPASAQEREAEARAEMLESYADFDDHLLEEIIEDKAVAAGEVYDVAAKTLAHHDLIPAFLGSATGQNGITRLMKSLRHEAPDVSVAADRLGADVLAVGVLGDIRKHLGKVVVLRDMRGQVAAGQSLGGANIGGLTALDARTQLDGLKPGEIGLAVKSDHLSAGEAILADAHQRLPDWAQPHESTYARVVTPVHEKDDTRLASALERLAEVDPALTLSQDAATGNPVVASHGVGHMRRVMEKLGADFGVEAEETAPPPALCETAKRGTEVHHRHRKQSGGAGQFADVVMTFTPLGRGEGFAFTETVKGGAVPKNYIPSVEAGAREALNKGPQGFPVVDIAIELTDGKSHSVDSSDYAFRMAGAAATREALAEVGTVLLQEIQKIRISLPSIYSGAMVPVISGMKGQVLGFEADPEAAGWDVFEAHLPVTQVGGLFAALASTTRGTARFTSAFDHYQEARREELADLL
ncbi:MAG: elongation factor G [Rhodobacterales bacterium]|nr:MAG: elongation factor G [Rhodobacterales bacterium]